MCFVFHSFFLLALASVFIHNFKWISSCFHARLFNFAAARRKKKLEIKSNNERKISRCETCFLPRARSGFIISIIAQCPFKRNTFIDFLWYEGKEEDWRSERLNFLEFNSTGMKSIFLLALDMTTKRLKPDFCFFFMFDILLTSCLIDHERKQYKYLQQKIVSFLFFPDCLLDAQWIYPKIEFYHLAKQLSNQVFSSYFIIKVIKNRVIFQRLNRSRFERYL